MFSVVLNCCVRGSVGGREIIIFIKMFNEPFSRDNLLIKSAALHLESLKIC